MHWNDERFRSGNVTIKQTKECYRWIVGPEQVDDLWKPDIYIDETVDGVNIYIICVLY